MERKTTSKNGCMEQMPQNGHGHDVDVGKKAAESCESEDRFQKLFSFRLEDLKSWNSFVRLLSRPTDPALLAYTRFIFGFAMVLDTIGERGLTHADLRWGDPEECIFPLFDWMRPLPLPWMLILYLIMLIGAIGVMLGAVYRVSSFMFLLPYWYILLLDKSHWNNHSYLFGIIAFLLAITDANRYWSVDGFFKRSIHNTDVPLWNYTLFRAQVFLVYFLAGLKKLDPDWVTGYSMENLGKHWVFEPFKFFMSDFYVDLLVVHIGGLTLDLSIGFLLFFDKTRHLAFFFCSAFHIMNACMFSIGMFPYVMLATEPLFCYTTWPRPLFRHIPRSLRLLTPDDGEEDTQPSDHCIYLKEYVKPEITPDSKTAAPPTKQTTPPSWPSLRHHVTAVFTIFFICWQLFLPYSHFITKGFNSWTQGLYGYSWDMMVHSWNHQHVRITFVDQDTGQRGYLNPDMWCHTVRWGGHPDMIQQYARCIATNLRKHNINNVEVYIDFWTSMNHRFQQRMIDPRVDVLRAHWSPFHPTPWMMPLLVGLSDWRSKMVEIQKSVLNTTQVLDVVFVADFPGLFLENYVHPDISTANISVLHGKVVVEVLPDEDNPSSPVYDNITLMEGQSILVPGGRFHNVHTVSEGPSCYMYIYANTTESRLLEGLKEFELALNGTNITEANAIPEKFTNDPNLDQYKKILEAKQAVRENEESDPTLIDRAKGYVQHKVWSMVRSYRMIEGAMHSIVFDVPFHTIMEEINTAQKTRKNQTSDS